MDVMEKIHQMEAAGIDVVHMEIGEPDFDVPECEPGDPGGPDCHATSYTHSLGDIRLREAIAQYHQDTLWHVRGSGQFW